VKDSVTRDIHFYRGENRLDQIPGKATHQANVEKIKNMDRRLFFAEKTIPMSGLHVNNKFVSQAE
jgi:hypothetical protein